MNADAGNAQLFARLSDLLQVPEGEILLRLGGSWEQPWLVLRGSAGPKYFAIALEDEEAGE
jgi:hypothetical protein